MVTSYFDPATKLIYAIGAVIGLIGGVRVYQKFSSGDPDTSKTAASWFGACIFLINKGVGRQVEFKGLRAQYLFLFAGGLLAVFILVVVLYMGGVDQVACLVAGVGLGGALVALTFRLNRKYGAYGLMKLLAARRHPRRIVSRKSVARILNRH